MDPELLEKMDIVITVCDGANEACPVVPAGVKRMHIPIKDPVNTVGTEEEIMADFRRARDEIREMVQKVLDEEL
jgi:arsenate reductase